MLPCIASSSISLRCILARTACTHARSLTFSLFLYELAYLLTTPVQNQGGGTTQVLLKHRSDDDRPFIVLAETKPRLCAQCIILAVSRAYGMCFSHVPSNVVCCGFLSEIREIQCTENQRFFFDKMQKKTRCVCGGPLRRVQCTCDWPLVSAVD